MEPSASSGNQSKHHRHNEEMRFDVSAKENFFSFHETVSRIGPLKVNAQKDKNQREQFS